MDKQEGNCEIGGKRTIAPADRLDSTSACVSNCVHACVDACVDACLRAIRSGKLKGGEGELAEVVGKQRIAGSGAKAGQESARTRKEYRRLERVKRKSRKQKP